MLQEPKKASCPRLKKCALKVFGCCMPSQRKQRKILKINQYKDKKLELHSKLKQEAKAKDVGKAFVFKLANVSDCSRSHHPCLFRTMTCSFIFY